MALMIHREPNQVKWVGTRPAHNGVQVSKNVLATNATTIIYTVSDNKTLFLCTASLGHYGIATGGTYLGVRNDGDVFQYYIHYVMCQLNYPSVPVVVTFWPPLEIPEKWDIIVVSGVAGLSAMGYVFGWEE